MAKSLSGLWLKSVRRMGRAQQAQGRRLLQSLMPKPARARGARCQTGQVISSDESREQTARATDLAPGNRFARQLAKSLVFSARCRTACAEAQVVLALLARW